MPAMVPLLSVRTIELRQIFQVQWVNNALLRAVTSQSCSR